MGGESQREKQERRKKDRSSKNSEKGEEIKDENIIETKQKEGSYVCGGKQGRQ